MVAQMRAHLWKSRKEPTMKGYIDGETIAMLKKIDGVDNMVAAEVETSHGLFRLEFDEKLQDTRWTIDVSHLIRDEDVA